MTNASRDQNFVPTMLGVLSTNGAVVVPIRVTPSNHVLHVSDGNTGNDHGPKNALRDENNVPTFLGVSSSDFSTPVAVYSDGNGKLLIQSS